MTEKAIDKNSSEYEDVALPMPRVKANLLVVGILFAIFSQQVMTYELTPAAPFLVEELNGWQWYALLFSLATMVQSLLTPAANNIGHILTMKRTLIGSIILFIIQFVMTMVAQSVPFVIAARCIGGVGAAGVFTCGIQMFVELFPPNERPKYSGYYSSVTAFCGVVGPVLAGWICDTWTWRYTPILSLVTSVIAIVLIIALMPSGRWHKTTESIDVKGLLLLAVGVVSIVSLCSFGGIMFDWASWVTAVLAVVGVLFIGIFFKFESKLGEKALIPVRLFKNRIFLAGFLLGFFGDGCFYVGRIYLPAYAQTVMGMNGTMSGLLVSVPSILSIIVGIVVGHFLARTGRHKLVLVFTMIVQAATLLFILVGTPDTPYPFYLGVMTFLFGFVNGALPLLPLALCQSRLDAKTAIQATAVIMLGLTIGCTVIVAIAGIVQNAIPDLYTGYKVLCIACAIFTFVPLPVVLSFKPDKWYVEHAAEITQSAPEGAQAEAEGVQAVETGSSVK